MPRRHSSSCPPLEARIHLLRLSWSQRNFSFGPSKCSNCCRFRSSHCSKFARWRVDTKKLVSEVHSLWTELCKIPGTYHLQSDLHLQSDRNLFAFNDRLCWKRRLAWMNAAKDETTAINLILFMLMIGLCSIFNASISWASLLANNKEPSEEYCLEINATSPPSYFMNCPQVVVYVLFFTR